MLFKGSMVALITPMLNDGTIDKTALSNLIEWHIAAGTDALVIAGTTGESATLSSDEHYDLISTVVQQVKGRVPVIAGTGTNATSSTIKLCENAERAKADGCLIVTPYYNKPTQEGLYQHYKTIAEKINLPIILYNVPGRTACDLQPATVERLAKIKHIIGIKEATGKLERMKEIQQLCGPSFALYSGDDATALDFMLQGGHGVISVTANVAPQKMAAMCRAALTGNVNEAKKLDAELALLHTRLFLESNPIPTKWALFDMGKIQQGIRLPLLPLDNQYHQPVKEAMQHAGV